MNMIENYWKLQKEYEKEYGEKTIILIEKGSFLECYATEEIGGAKTLAKTLNMILTKSNKNQPLSLSNPYMAGFPKSVKDKHISLLSSNGMTVVYVEQIWDEYKQEVKKREVTRVITPGTYIEDPPDDDSYMISCICVIKEKTGISMIDLSTNEVFLIDVNSKEDLHRMMETFRPYETIILSNEQNLEMNMTNNVTYKNIKDNEHYTKNEYQQQVINKVYENKYENEILNSVNQVTKTSFICLLDFIWKCHPTSITSLSTPIIKNDESIMKLHNTAIEQLNLYNKKQSNGINCLFDVINKTSTSMGRRYLKQVMLSPWTDVKTINTIYDEIEKLNSMWESMEDKLKQIPDIERMVKKMIMGTMNVHELNSFKTSFDVLKDLASMLKDDLKLEIINRLKNTLENIFNFHNQIFNKEVNEQLFDLHLQISECRTKIEETTYKYGNLLKIPQNSFKLDHTDKDGYFITTTLKRGEALKKISKDIILKKLTSSCKISTTVLDENCHLLSKLEQRYKKEFSEELKRQLKCFHDKNNQTLNTIIVYVKHCDFIKSMIKVSKMYGYEKPIIHECNYAYLKAYDLRHPIIERLQNECEYVPNDVMYNETEKGTLLYGVNGAGKSSYGKSIALCLILAQMGSYVPARYFEYSPYTQLFVRLNCDDNIYKGLSSFGVEMTELKSIIRCADAKSIVIGDELCKGTEDTSAVSLVASSVKWLLDHNVTFLFCTHLHKLPQISYLNDDRLKIKHIKSNYNKNLKTIVFERKISEGQGDSLYGIEIAKRILDCPEITNRAMVTRNTLTNRSNEIISTNKSKYNSKLYMNQCEKCSTSKTLHTHHIIYQSEFKNETHNTNKNTKSNLMVLCQKCHEDLHNGNFSIKTLDVDGKRKIIFE